jgi:DNA-directed RNA polymerase subunit RPC12/RpoP
MSMVKYRCEKCGKEVTADAKADNPECCNKEMKQLPLDACTTTHDAESYRVQNDDDACDDGVTK